MSVGTTTPHAWPLARTPIESARTGSDPNVDAMVGKHPKGSASIATRAFVDQPHNAYRDLRVAAHRDACLHSRI